MYLARVNANIIRPIENGMSIYEVLQHEIVRLSEAAQAKLSEHEDTMAYIDRLRIKLETGHITRRELFHIETEIEVLKSQADRVFRDYIRLNDECRGMKKAVDVIIYVHNNGGVVTDRNRRGVEALMNV